MKGIGYWVVAAGTAVAIIVTAVLQSNDVKLEQARQTKLCEGKQAVPGLLKSYSGFYDIHICIKDGTVIYKSDEKHQ